MATKRKDGRTVNCGLVSTPEYRDWVNRFAEHGGEDKSVLIGRALRALAASEGFEPPPNRVPRRSRPAR